MLITKEIEMTWTNNRNIYEPFGYKYTFYRDKFILKIEHLTTGSGYLVDVKCDYCGVMYPISYAAYNVQLNKSLIKKDCCTDCRHEKIKETSITFFNSTYSTNRHIDVDEIIIKFKDRGLIPKFTEYKDAKTLLPYVCKKHEAQGVQWISYSNFTHKTRPRGCWFCGMESKVDSSRKYNINDIRMEFKDNGYTLNSSEYISITLPLKYTCDSHPEIGEQTTTYWDFISARNNCSKCHSEAIGGENSPHWKGGLTSFGTSLRQSMVAWINKSKESCKNKCVLTGENTVIVHHLYSFNMIFLELLEHFGLTWSTINKVKLKEIDQDLIFTIKEKCLELHYQYGLGVCLSKPIHELFHNIYGRGNNTPEQFQEFTLRYKSGEFNETSQSEQIS